jgi:hypothetical protein
MSRCMRIRLTLDDDVAQLLKRAGERRRQSFEEVVNEALRAGLASLTES